MTDSLRQNVIVLRYLASNFGRHEPKIFILISQSVFVQLVNYNQEMMALKLPFIVKLVYLLSSS